LPPETVPRGVKPRDPARGTLSSPPDAVEPQPLIHSLLRGELTDLCRDLGQPAYRAAQVWRWLYVQGAGDWPEFRNLPRTLIERLRNRFVLHSAVIAQTQGETTATRKLLVELPDGERVEEVLIPAPSRRTVCVSSQVGCRYNCAFCASGQAGFRRNLQAGEMVGQVLLAGKVYAERPTHVVFMGIGEPLDNYDSVLRAVRIINDGEGLAVGARRITLSTCGIIPGIERLATEGLQVELSVSLHAPDDALRSKLMPVNRKYTLPALLEACRVYTGNTKRIITFEYTLIRGVNDSTRQAEALARLLRGIPCRVNLIPLSPIEEFPEQPPAPATAGTFIEVLDRAGINATLRVSKGCPLKAACGQLRFSGKA